MFKKKAARATAGTAGSKDRRKRHRDPPWGSILGGPIQRHDFLGDKRLDLDLAVGFTQGMQRLKMQRLLRHYRIPGDIPALPIAGFGDASWWPCYQLALALASELDDSLKIVDGPLHRKPTAARWRGDEGAVLLEVVDGLQNRPGSARKLSVRSCLRLLQTKYPFYKSMVLDELVVRYCEAKKFHRDTKRASKKGGTS
jgi:hypothetical protein